MAEDNKGLFSNINTFFKRATDALDATNNRFEPPQEKQFIKAASQEDATKTAVEDGALKFYRNQSTKIDKGNDQRKLMYESSRMMLYYDYLSMDGYPILGAALDLLSEEATTTKSDTGQILNIYCSSDKVKKELERFFYKVMDVNTNLFYWCRNMCQYGDNFVFLELSKDRGVVDFRQLASQFVERNEKYDSKQRFRAFFKYKDPNSGGEEEYLDYQVAHFRLLGTGDRLPYGCSVYEKVRRTYKQLFMMEDAMMVYRITRAAERRIYKVPVGNVPPEDVPQILEAFANNVKKKKLVDPKTGDINFKYNIASMDEDIFVADRGNTSGSFVDTLPGASNLEAISDINYLRDNLFTGLGIHKTLLGFSSDQASGEGKNLSMLDIRFARKVNRIQQALLGELNKIAIIHLGLLGGDYESYIDDFKLSLNNPSTASDLLQLEIWKSKLEVYAQATTPNQNTGLKPMSELMARKKFFHMSEEDIINDLQEQMLESKIGEEVKGAGMLLKTSGVMDKMIKYKNAGFKMEGQPQQGAEQQIDNSLGGGLGGGADMGGGAPPMGGGADLGGGAPPMGGGADLGGGAPPEGGGAGGTGFLSEEIIKKTNELDKLLKE
jgi:hypothetical protein